MGRPSEMIGELNFSLYGKGRKMVECGSEERTIQGGQDIMKRIFFIIMAVLFMGILPGTKVWAGNTGAYTDLIPTGDEGEDLKAKQVTFRAPYKWYII